MITGCVRFKPGKMEKTKCEVLQCALFYTVYPYRSPLELYTLFPALLPPPEDGGEYFLGDGGGVTPSKVELRLSVATVCPSRALLTQETKKKSSGTNIEEKSRCVPGAG